MIRTLPHEIVADELARMRAAAPLVHLLTNEVVQEITANVLLAAGASPAMIVAEEEVDAFAALSGALMLSAAPRLLLWAGRTAGPCWPRRGCGF